MIAYVALAFVAGGLMAGLGVFLYMRVAVNRMQDEAQAAAEWHAEKMEAASNAFVAINESVNERNMTIADLKAQLEAKNTRPAQPETRRVRARTMSQAAQMAEDDAARKDGR